MSRHTRRSILLHCKGISENLTELRKLSDELCDASGDLMAAKVSLEVARGEAEDEKGRVQGAAIEAAGGDYGRNETERKQFLASALVNNEDYQAILSSVRYMEQLVIGREHEVEQLTRRYNTSKKTVEGRFHILAAIRDVHNSDMLAQQLALQALSVGNEIADLQDQVEAAEGPMERVEGAWRRSMADYYRAVQSELLNAASSDTPDRALSHVALAMTELAAGRMMLEEIALPKEGDPSEEEE